MPRDQAFCLACASAVQSDARTCPACGYPVGAHDRRRLWLGGPGMALTLTVFPLSVGVPFFWSGRRHRLAAEGSVPRRAERSTGEHPVGTFGGCLSLERREATITESRRGATPPSAHTTSVSGSARLQVQLIERSQ